MIESVYVEYPTIAAALVHFAAGRCRRHVKIDGHVIDLVQVMTEQGRRREEPEAIAPPPEFSIAAAILHDHDVARNVRAELAGSAQAQPVCPMCGGAKR